MKYQTDVDPAFYQLAALKITRAEQLLDVLRGMSSVSFISAEAADNNGNKRVRAVYQRVYTDILKDMKIYPQAFNMARFLKFQEDLRIEISAINLTGVTAERGQGPPKTVHFTRSATGKGCYPSYDKKLEQKIARLEAPKSRPLDRRHRSQCAAQYRVNYSTSPGNGNRHF